MVKKMNEDSPLPRGGCSFATGVALEKVTFLTTESRFMTFAELSTLRDRTDKTQKCKLTAEKTFCVEVGDGG